MGTKGLTSSCRLELYLNHESFTSLQALENLSRLCHGALRGGYEVKVINILDAPDLADSERVVQTPTLIKRFPPPVRRVVGDLTDQDRVLAALDLPPSLLRQGTAVEDLSGAPADLTLDQKLLLESPDGALVVDADGTIVFANGEAERLFARSDAELVSRSLDVQWPDDESATFEIRVGSTCLEGRASAIAWDGRACRLVCLRDITHHLAAEARSSELARDLASSHRPEPSLRLRSSAFDLGSFQEMLAIELSMTRRAGAPLSVLLVEYGDGEAEILAGAEFAAHALSQMASSVLRPEDRIGRVGEASFLVLLPNTEPAAAMRVGERLLSTLKQMPAHGACLNAEGRLGITAALVPSYTTSVAEVLMTAAASLNRRQLAPGDQSFLSGGGNAVQPPPSRVATPRLQVVSQRIVDMLNGAPHGCELLVRAPSDGYEEPRTMFDDARSYGVAEQLDLHCLRASLTARAGVPALRHHINVLPQTLTQHPGPAFERLVQEPSGAAPLCLEISGEEIIGDPEPLLESRATLRDRGIAFALDNARFSRSTLESIMILKPDIVKIDRGLVGNVSHHAGQARDLRRLVAAAQTLGIEVIAQGVESQEDVSTLLALGVTSGQGFLWDRPQDVPGQALSH